MANGWWSNSVLMAALWLSISAPTRCQSYVVEWVRTQPAEAGLNSRGLSIAATSDGQIVVAGSIDDANGEPDYLARQYNGPGETAWTTRYASARQKNNFLADITLDPFGNILLTGNSDTVKLDRFGERVWSAPINGRSIAANARHACVATLSSSGYSIAQVGNEVPAPMDLILDCDPGQDADDMSDLAIINNLMTRGEVNILAMMGAHKGPWIPVNIDVMNRYYGHPDIPVAVAQEGPWIPEGYGWYMEQRYGTRVDFSLPQTNSVNLYRSILASRPDRSVTILFSGQIRNLLSLWHSTPDAASPLYGPALLAKKVRQLVLVAGVFPDSGAGGEWNLAADAEAAQVINDLTDAVSVTYIGIEEGNPIEIPAKGVGVMDEQNPVRYAHELFGAPTRPSWTGLGLLLAARGLSWNGTTYFTTVTGRAFVRPNGSNGFVPDENANQRYIRKTQADSRYIEILDDLLLTPPPQEPQPAAIDKTGHVIWSRPFSGDVRDVVDFLAVNSLGEVFAGGVQGGGYAPGAGRFGLVKYGEAGSVRWSAGTTNILQPHRSQINLCAMTVADDGIWLFGQYGESPALFKFSTDGAQLWNYNFTAGTTAGKMVVDQNGSVCVANTSPRAIVVTRIDSNGVLVGEATYQSDPQREFHLEAAAQDSSGAVYLAGGLSGGGNSEIFLLRFNQDLSQSALTTYPCKYAGDARATAMALQGSGDVYLTGYQPTGDGGSELFLLKLTAGFKMEKLETGALRFTYHVGPNEQLSLEGTRDFSEWEHVATARADGRGLVQIEDTNAMTLPARFYRTKKD